MPIFLDEDEVLAALADKAPAPVATSVASTSTLTPAATSDRVHAAVTAQAEALAIAAPTGSPVDFANLLIRIKDNGTARALAWTTSGAGSYRAMSVTLPTTTTAGKTMYIAARFNAADNRWDVLSVTWED